MADIKELIRRNVEIEGLLKVLLERDSIDAHSLLAEKFAEYQAMFTELLAEPAPTATQKVAEMADNLEEEAQHTEVKDQEAESSEVDDETDAATAAIERGEIKQQAQTEHRAPNTALLKAFTLNDKFRFIRDIFNGSEGEFTDTLNVLADMDNAAEATDYLLNDMMLDRENPAVADFLSIVCRSMPE